MEILEPTSVLHPLYPPADQTQLRKGNNMDEVCGPGRNSPSSYSHPHCVLRSFLLGFDFLLAAIYRGSFQDHPTFDPFSKHNKTLKLLGEHNPACCTLSVTSAPLEELRTPQDK